MVTCPICGYHIKHGPTIKRHKSQTVVGTPWGIIRACEARYGPITLDLAASKENTKASIYFTEEQDSLSLPWVDNLPWMGENEWMWLNPPFDKITPWAKKCALEGQEGCNILFLTPASVGAKWFRQYVEPFAEVSALDTRITFIGSEDPYPKDCMISAFGPGITRRFMTWDWRGELMADPMFN